MRAVLLAEFGVLALAFVEMGASSSSGRTDGATAASEPGSNDQPILRARATALGAAVGVDRDQGRDDLNSSDPVAYSSRMIAAARALESRRQDRLFSDPYAELLAGPDAIESSEERAKVKAEDEAAEQVTAAAEAGKTTTNTTTKTSTATTGGRAGGGSERRLAIRTRFCDDFFEDCTVWRGIKQIVSVGAGMDTRGLRLKASEGTKVFEVDRALVLRVKRALLSAAAAADGVAASTAGFRERRDMFDGVGQARVVPVEADVGAAGWEGELLEAGFDPSAPSAWILEGLTMYLDEHELVDLIRVLANLCAPGSSAFCATCVSAESVVRARSSGNPLMGTWKWGSDDPQAFFEDNFPEGWEFKGVTCGTPGEFPDGADYGVGFKGKAPAYVIGYSPAAVAAASSVGSEQEL